MLTGFLLTFLISHYFRARGWAYSLLFTYAGGLAFVVWLPSRAALWLPQVVTERLHQLSVFAAELGHFSLIAAVTLAGLAILGSYTGYCLFKCVRRIVVAFTEQQKPSATSTPRWRVLRGLLLVVEAIPVISLGTWVGFEFVQLKIEHLRRIDPAEYVSHLSSELDSFRAWSLSRDGDRLLAIDHEYRLHDISLLTGVDRLAGNRSAALSLKDGIFPVIEMIRECQNGTLLVIERSQREESGFSFQFVEIATAKPISSTQFPIPADSQVKGLSPSGRLLVTQSSSAELPGAASLLVWDMDAMDIQCELDTSILSEGAKEYTVLLNDPGTLFAADIPKGETDAGRSVTVYSNEMEIIIRLRRVECRGEIQAPPLVFANSGNWVWGRFAGLRDPLTNSYPVVEQIFSVVSLSPRQAAASEYGGMNLAETLVLDPFYDRVLRLDFASEFDHFDSPLLGGEEIDLFPILGIQCRQQVMRRRLRLSSVASGGRVAVSTASAPLSSSEHHRLRTSQLYSLSLRHAQFSQDGSTVIIVEDYDPLAGRQFDVWRMPVPAKQEP